MDLFRTKNSQSPSCSTTAANTSRYSLVSSLWSVQVQVQREGDVAMDFRDATGSQQSLPTCCPNKGQCHMCSGGGEIELGQEIQQWPGGVNNGGIARSKSLSDLRVSGGPQTMSLDCCQNSNPTPMDASVPLELRMLDDPSFQHHRGGGPGLSQHQRDNICDWLNRLSVNNASDAPSAPQLPHSSSGSEGSSIPMNPAPPSTSTTTNTGPYGFRRTSYALKFSSSYSTFDDDEIYQCSFIRSSFPRVSAKAC